jgi:hypothetical protein
MIIRLSGAPPFDENAFSDIKKANYTFDEDWKDISE